MQYSNNTQVPLSMAVYLATDHYDYDPDAISTTSLMKPIRQTILKARVPSGDDITDVTSLVKSRVGTSIHDGIEKAWMGDYRSTMVNLGYPQSVADRVVVNPDPNNLPEDAIPVYMEQRLYREINGTKISGKFDFVAEDRVEDFKTTSTFTWKSGGKDEDYQLQGSIYRWLGPHIIKDDHMVIQFLFTDWMPGKAAADPTYPQRQVEPRKIPLLSLDDTEAYIVNKLAQIKQHWDTDEDKLPLCNDKELWRKEPVFKYYKNPAKMVRSTKNYADRTEAYNRLATDGGKGIVIEKPGEVIACRYCPAFVVCTQKDSLLADGSLTLT